MKRGILLVAGVCVLSACTQAITFRNPATGEIAKCGPYMMTATMSAASTFRESQCISDFQRQGYVRVSN